MPLFPTEEPKIWISRIEGDFSPQRLTVYYVSDEIGQAADHDLLYTPELLGQECLSCARILRWHFFEKDSSYKNGYKPQCIDCRSQPALSMEEHTARLQQLNYRSEAVQRQRHEDQEEFRDRDMHSGRPMHCSDLLLKLHKLVPSLFVKPGGIVGHLALYQVAEQPQQKWDGRNYNYLGYAEFTLLPEFSIYEFDEKKDVVLRASVQGWRDVLLRFIRAGLLTEDQVNKEFGRATGRASTVWYKRLWSLRNQ